MANGSDHSNQDKARPRNPDEPTPLLRPDTWAILIIFTLTLAFRLTLAFQTPYLTDDDSYFWSRQAEHIIETGTPLNQDPLSWNGRTLSFSPLFAYILAFAALFGPLAISGKILLNILAASASVFVYLISLHLTGSRHVAGLSSLVSAMSPILVAATTTSLTSASLTIPLFCLLIYSYIRLETHGWTIAYLCTLAIFSFLSPLSVIFIIGLLVHLTLCAIEGVSLRKEEPEIILFSVFFSIWAALIQYKKAILSHGLGFIWQNIPSGILNSYFTDVNILAVITNIGLVPLGASIFITYRYLLRKQSIHTTLLISQSVTIGTILYFRLLNPPAGYTLLALVLSMLCSIGYQSFLTWLSTTRFGATHTFAPLAIFILIVATSLLPSLMISKSTIENSDLEYHVPALEWLSSHSAQNATVFAAIDEGHMINALAHRPTMIDADFMLHPEAQKRHQDFTEILQTPVTSTAIDILSRHNVQYIYISPRLSSQIPERSTWIKDENCFTPIYTKQIVIYQVTCQLQSI